MCCDQPMPMPYDMGNMGNMYRPMPYAPLMHNMPYGGCPYMMYGQMGGMPMCGDDYGMMPQMPMYGYPQMPNPYMGMPNMPGMGMPNMPGMGMPGMPGMGMPNMPGMPGMAPMAMPDYSAQDS
ncbi:MAG: hypothetical protein H7Y41_06025 [Hyphomonadaceae bacterium]|nr:hypothetical protein [Clostridia bacterium]